MTTLCNNHMFVYNTNGYIIVKIIKINRNRIEYIIVYPLSYCILLLLVVFSGFCNEMLCVIFNNNIFYIIIYNTCFFIPFYVKSGYV